MIFLHGFKTTVINMNKKKEDHYTELYNNRFLAFLLKYQHILIYTGIGILLIIVIGFQISRQKTRTAEKSFIKTHDFMTKLEKSKEISETYIYIQELEALLKKYPQLKTIYSDRIAQNLLSKNMAEEALQFYALPKHLDPLYLEFYGNFSDNSITIAQGKYELALKRALELKDNMLGNKLFANQEENIGNVLFAYNLIRIAHIYQELGDHTAELNSWEELEEYSLWNEKNKSPIYTLIKNNFSEGDVSLINYIEFRRNVLQNK